ncbi:hypothetical protein [Capnocytophaga canimorsus]|uniref:hypothetical protein n=1 Tax=Capnocytophaga canimorsus TaxID=28188 RepID=UPI0037D0511C
MEEKLSLLFNSFSQKGFDYEVNFDEDLLYFLKTENDTKKYIQIEVCLIKNKIRMSPSVANYIEIVKVEEILEQVTNQKTYLKNTISASIGIDKNNAFSNDYFFIKTKKDLEKYVQLLDVYYNNHIQPFFEAIPTLQSFNDKVLSVVPFDEYHNYLSGKFGLKAMIIMFLCKNPLYKDYVLYREKGFENSPNLQDVTSRYYKTVKQSFEEFNKFKEMVEKGEI